MTNKVKIIPGPGLVLIWDLSDEQTKKITNASTIEISGANPHDQLKLGRVLSVGSVRFTESGFEIESPAKVDDIIAYQSLASHNIRVAGTQYRLIDFEHIKAIIGGIK